MRRLKYCVAHTLTGRYINGEILEITQFERVDQYVDSFCTILMIIVKTSTSRVFGSFSLH